jgi:hypothetical protein
MQGAYGGEGGSCVGDVGYVGVAGLCGGWCDLWTSGHVVVGEQLYCVGVGVSVTGWGIGPCRGCWEMFQAQRGERQAHCVIRQERHTHTQH